MTSFLNACGVSDSLRLIVEGPDRGRTEIRLLRQPFAIIGRNPRADVVLDHPRVSRRHIYLQVVEGRAFWIDVGSRTGTRVGKRSQKLGWLDGRQTLGIGPYEIRLSEDTSQNADSGRLLLSQDAAPFLVRAYSGALMPEVALEFLNGPSQSTRWPVRRVMSLLGSASGCKLRLADPSVSRFHASLLRTPMGLWIVDLLGQSGISVNSIPVRFSRLEDADVLEIGRYQIRVQCAWQVQETGGRSPGSTSLSPLRGHNHDPSRLRLRDWATTPKGFTPESETSEGAETHLLPQPFRPPASVELMPSDSAYPVKPDQSDSTQSILVPLVNQFGLMQQQMFDQFQQAMSMLVQMFGKMHRDQMEVIRAELDRLRELTQEFQSLKDELAKRTEVQSQSVSGKFPDTWPMAASADHRQGEDLSGLLPTQRPTPKSQTPPIGRSFGNLPTGQTGSTAFSPILPKSGSPGEDLSGKIAPPTSPAVVPLGQAASPLNSDQVRSGGSRSQDGSANLGPAADADKDTIIWLHQRIMAIQNERESRWQKILKLLPGVS
jgi:pSer/pThr/pTyr-binding forkhead associated (FHA) protein